MTPTVLFVLALAAGLYMAWNIGANDVANAMGTSVGSGALSFRRAIILAGIFEFCGAFFVGSNVAETIQGGIVSPRALAPRRASVVKTPSPPGGGRAAASAAAAAPAGAEIRAAELREPGREAMRKTAMKLALGMLAALLAAAVWLNIATFFGQPVSTTHTIIGAVIGFAIVDTGLASVNWWAMGKIVGSWIISPLAGGIVAYILYRCIRRFVLRSPQPIHMAERAVPLGFGAVVLIITLSILYKGLPRLRLDLPLLTALPLALTAGLVAAVTARTVIYRRMRSRPPPGQRYDVVERWFGRIQPVTACYMAFAHGANDVANAVGPLAGVLELVSGGEPAARAVMPAWLLALGGAAIVVGLATYGHKVIEAVGKKITEITPSRGFSAEFATASTVLVCSKLGLPISTTFVLVGAVMGVGVARGFGAIDLRVIRRILTSWVITIPVAAILSALIYCVLGAIEG
ncbi:MAG: hypothetical protein AMJ81_11205 [Phycisphaerae bacterium SM23_33]|nr:MAG: hypothetical protein AMJ81_11205 [Phycisphaerae bacterium SM23_33]